MERIKIMGLTEKIILLEYIKKHYSQFKKTWTSDKVLWLEKQINVEVDDLIGE